MEDDYRAMGLEAIDNLKQFNKKQQTEKAIMHFMQTCILPDNEKDEMRQIFKSIDKNFDYVLTKQELAQGLRRMGLANANQATDDIFKLMDADEDGSIQFSEFCTATIDQDKLL